MKSTMHARMVPGRVGIFCGVYDVRCQFLQVRLPIMKRDLSGNRDAALRSILGTTVGEGGGWGKATWPTVVGERLADLKNK